MQSFLSHLKCTNCGNRYSADDLHTTCPSCGKVLFARYDLAAARHQNLIGISLMISLAFLL